MNEEGHGSGSRTSPPPLRSRRLALTFEAFHDTYHRGWLRFAHLQVGDADAARTVVDLLCAQLAGGWSHALKQGNVQFYAWALLKEHIAARLEERNHRVALVETAAFASAVTRMLDVTEDRFAVLECGICLYGAIARLPERQYDAVVLRFVLGYPEAEAAALLGVKASTVRSTVSFAKRRMAKDLDIAWETQIGG
ncbi:RNA polymerase sigma factor [Wenjunlia tyrosinilytica]|uniref:RNA polymerase sigma factor n=1 Tax=Wenjunlia tyrosinilytica TaxID=1544741 RepID=UPI001664A111|nr:sigma factor-like helix-turn-helix DNA-binding protein [Wenjunlia tyrosinilytica]